MDSSQSILEKISCPGIGGADKFTCTALQECCKDANECCYKDTTLLCAAAVVLGIIIIVVVVVAAVYCKAFKDKKKHTTAMVPDVEQACDQTINVGDKRFLIWQSEKDMERTCG